MTVIDTNVLVVANDRPSELSDDITPACIEASVNLLRTVQRSGHVVIDDGYRILREYRTHASGAGQPGVGDAFFKWLWDTHCVAERCTQVHIDEHETRGFAQFPTHPALAAFDPYDRKFVAVSAAHPERPPIAFAADGGWLDHAAPLTNAGVRLNRLCPPA